MARKRQVAKVCSHSGRGQHGQALKSLGVLDAWGAGGASQCSSLSRARFFHAARASPTHKAGNGCAGKLATAPLPLRLAQRAHSLNPVMKAQPGPEKKHACMHACMPLGKLAQQQAGCCPWPPNLRLYLPTPSADPSKQPWDVAASQAGSAGSAGRLHLLEG
jgi:hypothetical protein